MQNDKRFITLPCFHMQIDPGTNPVSCPVCGKMYTKRGEQFTELPGRSAFAEPIGRILR
jgi:hypothetical protein